MLHDLDFEVRQGEVLGILGPNGAGKTTLFNLISGDIRDYTGEIRFQDRPLVGPPFKRCHQDRAHLPDPRPYAGMSTFENLLVAATFGGGMAEADSYDHCVQVLEACELTQRANTNAGSLTLLDRKRLELARALASRPRLLLLDEIAGGLTEDEGKDLVALIKRIRDGAPPSSGSNTFCTRSSRWPTGCWC